MFERGEEIIVEVTESLQNSRKSQSRLSRHESGYSEEEQVRIIEGSQVDIKQVKKRKPLLQVSRQQKIVIAYQELSEKVFQLVTSLSSLHGENLRKSEHILEDIREIRKMQDELLNALVLEQKGNLDKSAISKSTWNLIE